MGTKSFSLPINIFVSVVVDDTNCWKAVELDNLGENEHLSGGYIKWAEP